MDENLSAIVNSKDKIKYLDSLKEFLDREEKSTKSWKTLPKDITTILMALYECCQSLQKISEKTDLINRGLFASLMQIINRNGPNEEANEYPILILEELCDDNPECCNSCCKSFVALLKTSGQWESSGIYQTLNRLCDRSLFQTVCLPLSSSPTLVSHFLTHSLTLFFSFLFFSGWKKKKNSSDFHQASWSTAFARVVRQGVDHARWCAPNQHYGRDLPSCSFPQTRRFARLGRL